MHGRGRLSTKTPSSIRRSMRMPGRCRHSRDPRRRGGRVRGLRRARALGRLGRARRAGLRLGPQPRRRPGGRSRRGPTRAGSRSTGSSCCPRRRSSAAGCSRARTRRPSCTCGGCGGAPPSARRSRRRAGARAAPRARDRPVPRVRALLGAGASPRRAARVRARRRAARVDGRRRLIVGPAVPPVFAVARGTHRPLRGRRPPDAGRRGRRRRSSPLARNGALRSLVARDGRRAVRRRRHALARPERGSESGSRCGCPRITSAITPSATPWSSAWSLRSARTVPAAARRAHGSSARPRRGPHARLGAGDARSRAPGPGFRIASVPVERLWRVVEDPRADREARTGAAIALAPALHDDERARLRAVADGCAEPRLRIALATAATEAARAGRRARRGARCPRRARATTVGPRARDVSACD